MFNGVKEAIKINVGVGECDVVQILWERLDVFITLCRTFLSDLPLGTKNTSNDILKQVFLDHWHDSSSQVSETTFIRIVF